MCVSWTHGVNVRRDHSIQRIAHNLETLQAIQPALGAPVFFVVCILVEYSATVFVNPTVEIQRRFRYVQEIEHDLGGHRGAALGLSHDLQLGRPTRNLQTWDTGQ